MEFETLSVYGKANKSGLRRGTASVIVFVCAVFVFSRNHDGLFVFDDVAAIVKNADVHGNTTTYYDVVMNDFWGTPLMSNKSHKSYRPLTVTSFRFNSWLSNVTNPKLPLNRYIFHGTNILLHAICCVFVLHFFLILYYGQRYFHHKPGDEARGIPKEVFIGTVLFALHPIHCENVSSLVGRADVLSAIFAFITFYSYCKACLSMSEGRLLATQLWLTMVVCNCILSVLSKEIGLTIMGLCLAYDIIYVEFTDIRLIVQKLLRRGYSSTNQHQQSKTPVFQISLKFVYRFVWVMFWSSVILYTRLWWQDFSTINMSSTANPHAFAQGRFWRGVNYQYLYAMNVWLLACPDWLCCDWSFGCLPVMYSVLDHRAFAGLLFLITLFSYIWFTGALKQSAEKRKTTLALATIVIPFMPSSNLFVRVGFTIAERILYVPSIGFCLLVAIGYCRIIHSPKIDLKLKMLAKAGLSVLLVCFVLKTMQRDKQWARSINLYKSALRVCPKNAKMYYNIAITYENQDKVNESIPYHQKAISIPPIKLKSAVHLAEIYNARKSYSFVAHYYEQVVKIEKDNHEYWRELGIAQGRLNRTAAAAKSLQRALALNSSDTFALHNLGNAWSELGDKEKAEGIWHNLTILEPTQISFWNRLIDHYIDSERYAEAENAIQSAMMHLPDNAALYHAVARIHHLTGRLPDSETSYRKAIELDDQNPTYQANLGVLYHKMKLYSSAITQYKRALYLNPFYKFAWRMLERAENETTGRDEGFRESMQSYEQDYRNKILKGWRPPKRAIS